MLQPIDLFCHTILLAKFYMLTSFNLHFLANNEEAYTSHDFPVEQGHSASPIKYGVIFSLKLFMAVAGQVIWINLLENLLVGVND